MIAEPLAAIRSFVDLRDFAADASAGFPTTETGDAWLSARRLLPVQQGVVDIAVLDLDGGSGRIDALAADEFVILLKGELSLSAGEAGNVVLVPERGLVIPAGIAFGWTAQAGTQAIVVRCDSGAPGAKKPVLIDYAAALVPSNPPAPELLASATPSCRNHTDYLSASGEFMAGTWDSTPYRRVAIDYPHYELMHILAGSVTFEDEKSGAIHRFVKDDIFVVTQGARCSWDSDEHCAKLYVIYRPK